MMLRATGLLAFSAAASAQTISGYGCGRRLDYDFSVDSSPLVSMEWVNGAGTLKYPATTATPSIGVPYGVTGPDSISGDAAFPFGEVRFRNVAFDSLNGGRGLDLLITAIPDSEMNVYSGSGPTQFNMSYNSPISPPNDAYPASQIVLSAQGFACIGFGVFPSYCASGSEVSSGLATCEDGTPIVGRATEFLLRFVFNDTKDTVTPTMPQSQIYFWDVDGDYVNNGLTPYLNTNMFTPFNAAPYNYGPLVEDFEAVHEINSVWGANRVDFAGTNVNIGSFGAPTWQSFIEGSQRVNIPTDFFTPPTTLPVPAVSEPALGVYRTNPETSSRVMIGARSAVGKLYIPGREPNSVPPGALKIQNDRGYCFSMRSPEPICTCNDACPAECADVTTAPAWCARNPNCICPDSCKAGGVEAFAPDCGMNLGCPSTPCPGNCTGAAVFYFAYCTTNPNCQLCPAGCTTTPPNPFLPCNIYASCPQFVTRTCGTIPTPPPFPPPFPPLPCAGWCTESTCGNDECRGCSTCDTVAAGQYCASWCNAYTCASEHQLCQGCSVCNTPASSSSCYSWCSAYTCFGSCTSCSVCQQVTSGQYCASWCNAYTCGGAFSSLCGGCSECTQVNANQYCASWCNSYTRGGIFTSLCGGC